MLNITRKTCIAVAHPIGLRAALALLIVGSLIGSTGAVDRMWTGTLSQDFNNILNWTPAGIPGAADNAFISLDAANVTTSVDARVENLSLDDGAVMSLTVGSLIVDSTLSLNENTASAVQLAVNNTADVFDLDAAGIDVLSGAALVLNGGTVEIRGTLSIDASSSAGGTGVLEAAAGTSNAVVNDGLIAATGTLLTIRRGLGSAARFDLDGTSEAGRVQVISGTADFTLDGPLADNFNGTLDIGDGNTAMFSSGWTLASTGHVMMSGGASGPAVLAGGATTLGGSLTVSQAAEITAPVTFSSTADVTVNAGGVLDLNNTATFQGGTHFGAGEISNNVGMIVTAPTTIIAGVFDADGTAENATLTIRSGAVLTIISAAIDDGDIGFDGLMVIEDTAELSISTTNTWAIDTGLLRLAGSGSVIRGQNMNMPSPSGRLEGIGTLLIDVTSNGVIAPGLSVGTLTSLDSFALLATATLEIEIGGPTTAEYDRLVAGNQVQLGGTLDLRDINDFIPQFGDVYEIVSAGFAVIGCFTSILGQDIPGPLVLAHEYTATEVLIHPTLPGDANFDGMVSGADFTIWNDNFGVGPYPDFAHGDFNADCAVTGADFTIWADHFGQVAMPDMQAVPEPAGWMLAVAAAAFCGGWSLRKAQCPVIVRRIAGRPARLNQMRPIGTPERTQSKEFHEFDTESVRSESVLRWNQSGGIERASQPVISHIPRRIHAMLFVLRATSVAVMLLVVVSAAQGQEVTASAFGNFTSSTSEPFVEISHTGSNSMTYSRAAYGALTGWSQASWDGVNGRGDSNFGGRSWQDQFFVNSLATGGTFDFTLGFDVEVTAQSSNPFCASSSAEAELNLSAAGHNITLFERRDTFGGTPLDIPDSLTLTATYVSGQSNFIQVTMLTAAVCSSLGNPCFGVSASAVADLGNGVTWEGISNVRDQNGNPVTDFTVTSLSGFDYANPVFPPGDANGDGCVSGADFTVWNDHFGAGPGATRLQGDFNFDGFVTGADFTVWNDHFGEGCEPTTAVPEPAGWLLVVVGLLALVTRTTYRR